MDRQRLEVMKQVVDGRQSIQWAAASLFNHQFHVVHDRIDFLICCLSYAYFLR